MWPTSCNLKEKKNWLEAVELSEFYINIWKQIKNVLMELNYWNNQQQLWINSNIIQAQKACVFWKEILGFQLSYVYI